MTTPKPWNVPTCNECKTKVFVDRSNSIKHLWRCHNCDRKWGAVDD